MAKTTAGLLSLGARGSVAKTLTFSSWRGQPYVRQLVTPANPNTTAQQSTRNVFRTMNQMWVQADELMRAPWDLFALGRRFLGQNQFIGQNVRASRPESNFQEFIGSPGARGGLPMLEIAGVAGSSEGEIDVTITAPSPPPDWELVRAVAMAFPDQDPHVDFVGPFAVDDDETSPYVITLTGLGDAVPCVVAGWLEWTKPNGQTAYSPSLTTTATSGAS